MRVAGWDPLLEALLDLTFERGYEAIAVADVVERAGVPADEFERRFASKDACALALFDAFLTDYQAFVRAAYEGEAAWPDSMRAAAYAVAEWIEAHPREVRFGTVDMLWAGEVFQAHREAGFQSFVDIIDAGREAAPDPAAIPAAAAESVIGSIAELMTKRLRHGKLDFYALVPQLMYLAVLPYLGEKAAARELTIPPPSRRSGRG